MRARDLKINCLNIKNNWQEQNHSKQLLIIPWETTQPEGPREPWHHGKDAKWDHFIQLICGEGRTHTSFKTTKTWESVNNQGTKMSLLSYKLWLIANNSENFPRKKRQNSASSAISSMSICMSNKYIIYQLFLWYWR